VLEELAKGVAAGLHVNYVRVATGPRSVVLRTVSPLPAEGDRRTLQSCRQDAPYVWGARVGQGYGHESGAAAAWTTTDQSLQRAKACPAPEAS
jgi:hypothetical protein